MGGCPYTFFSELLRAAQRFAGEGGEALEKFADHITIQFGDFDESQSCTDAGSAMRDYGGGLNFGLPEPNANFYFCSRRQLQRNFDVTATQAKICDGAAQGGSTLDVNLDGILTTVASVFSSLDAADLVGILGVGGEREIPQRFFGSDIQQADMTGGGGAGSADPFHAEMDAIVAVGEADDLVDLEVRVNAG